MGVHDARNLVIAICVGALTSALLYKLIIAAHINMRDLHPIGAFFILMFLITYVFLGLFWGE